MRQDNKYASAPLLPNKPPQNTFTVPRNLGLTIHGRYSLWRLMWPPPNMYSHDDELTAPSLPFLPWPQSKQQPFWMNNEGCRTELRLTTSRLGTVYMSVKMPQMVCLVSSLFQTQMLCWRTIAVFDLTSFHLLTCDFNESPRHCLQELEDTPNGFPQSFQMLCWQTTDDSISPPSFGAYNRQPLCTHNIHALSWKCSFSASGASALSVGHSVCWALSYYVCVA